MINQWLTINHDGLTMTNIDHDDDEETMTLTSIKQWLLYINQWLTSIKPWI